MLGRSPARIAAPLAILACLLAFVLVVSSSSTGGDTSTADTKASTTRTTAKAERKPKAAPKTYTVKEGDLLSTIADKTGVATPKLLELNPDVDPSALNVGDVIKLR